ncbi:MAG: cytosolic protein [Candidatus Kapabacteria bacterium]|jgi:hypothetical protein|nr:cytosolic protein [Candidatus Kapabacteria bacterium]
MSSPIYIRNNDFDTPWKEAIEMFFEEFMTMFFPEAARQIDWDEGYEFLDNELQQIVRDAELGKRIADKLVRVRLLGNGAEQIIIVHIEIQGQHDPDFAKRMYIYHYRLFDKYDRRIASMALLTDDNEAWRPYEYSYEALGCELCLHFPLQKMSDFAKTESEWKSLETSTNPFAVVIMAHLKSQQTRGNADERLNWKIRIAKGLYQSSMPKTTVLELMRFLDWLMTLPDDIQQQFTTVSHDLETSTMPYYADFELRAMNRGLQQGLEQGLQQGLHRALLNIIRKKFPEILAFFAPRIEAITNVEILQEAVALLVLAETPDDVRRIIQSAEEGKILNT